MKKCYLLLFLIIANFAYCQNELDSIFSDEKGEFHANIGIDALRIASGVPTLQFGADFSNKKVILRGQIGSTLMGYKLQMAHKIIEKNVKPGIVWSIGAAHKVFELTSYYEGKFYLGGELEFWYYNAENMNMLKNSGSNEYKLNGIEIYVDDNYAFSYTKKSLGIGLIYGYIMPITQKIDFQTFISFGKVNSSLKFKESSSYGIHWPDEAPTNWITLHKIFYPNFYGRLTLGINYNFM